ncbi:MAG: ComEC/Rec2 family competence protein [bacterium]|nr:ComEC/Rec2 family competence protein [bacterium]
MRQQYITRLITGKRVPFLPWAAACFIAGLLTGSHLKLPGLAMLFLGIVFITAGKTMARSRYVLLCLLAGFFLVGLGRMCIENEKDGRIRRFFDPCVEQKKKVELTGTVVSYPQIRVRGTHCRAKCIVRAQSINGTKTPPAKFLAYLYDNDTDSFPQIGDTLRCTTKVTVPVRYQLNRTLTYDQYLQRRAILFTAKCTGKHQFAVVADGCLPRWFHAMRNRFLAHLEYGIAYTQEAELLQAMVFGEQPDVSRQLLDRFAALGTIHVLVISGLHVGCLAFITLTLLQFAGMRRGCAVAGMIFVLLFYLVLVGARVSIVRAVVMIVLYFTADFLKRERNPLHAVICAGWMQLLVLPNLIFDHGFQYSFLAVLGIIIFYPICKEAGEQFLRYALVRALCITFVVWIVISPLSAYRNGLFLPLGAIVSAVYAGLTYCVVMNGMAASVAGFISSGFAQIINMGNYLILKIMIAGADVVAGWRSGSFYFGAFPSWGLIVYYAVLACILISPMRSKWKLIAVSAAYCAIIAWGIAYQG